MTIKQLVSGKNPILQKKIPDVSLFDESLAQLLLDLVDTLYEVEAHAICAPQTSISQKVATIDMDADGLLQLINPTIISESNTTVNDLEGAVSLPGVFGEVIRGELIVIKSNRKY